jgi:hypothetical protein
VGASRTGAPKRPAQAEFYPPLIAAITSTREAGRSVVSSPPRSRST